MGRSIFFLILCCSSSLAQLPVIPVFNFPPKASGGGPQAPTPAIYADVVIDMTSTNSPGTTVDASIATNATHGFVTGPWTYEVSGSPVTNFFVYTNTVGAPTNFFCDGGIYNGLTSTNNWRETNSQYQWLTFKIPGSNSIFSCAFMLAFKNVGISGFGYSLNGFWVGSTYDIVQYRNDGFMNCETTAGGSQASTGQSVPVSNQTNVYWYITGIINTNLGQTLFYYYTNNAGSWQFAGSCSNYFTPTTGDGNNYFLIGRQDAHGDVSNSTFDFGFAAVDWTYAHFPLGPLPWTNAWAPVISGVGTIPLDGTCDVIWNTDHSANSTVNYGLTASYGSSTNLAATARSHAVFLRGLSAGTTYHYQVSSTNQAGLSSVSADGTFATLLTGCTNNSGLSVSGTTTDAANWQNSGNSDKYLAQKIIPATNTTICTILAPWYKSGSAAAQNITSYIWTNDVTLDQPGAIIATAVPTISVAGLSTTAPGTTISNGGAWATNSFNPITLIAGGKYWFGGKESPDSSSAWPIWPNANVAPGGNSMMQSANGGSTWSVYFTTAFSFKYYVFK